MAITATNGSSTIGVTEFFLVSGSTTQTPQTGDAIVQVFLDTSALAAGDSFQITMYEKVNASTQRVVWQSFLTGASSQPQMVYPAVVLMDGWEIGVKKLLGTDRLIQYSVRKIA